ncbi:MAG: hypothetical protein IK072_03050, partial [Clostridia bacterium]|nr:hypothetical protein [Clostridia bacterium]
MKNTFLSLCVILCMLLGFAVVPASATIVSNGTCGDNLTWTLDDNGRLTISGTGTMTDHAWNGS